jgi:hypothetical protein
MTCKSCNFWLFQPAGNMGLNGEGHCRRYPPRLDPNYFLVDRDSITEESTWWSQPIVHEDDWCGEYK